MTEDIYETFKINFLNCLKEEKSGRRHLLSRCSSALLNAKSNLKKLLILFGQVMFKNDNDYEKELIVNDKNVTDSVIKLLNDALSNKINENDFFSQLSNLSKTINFFYHASKLYSEIFLIESEYYEIFTTLIFKKKYQGSKEDYINSISILISGVNADKFKYEELLNYINKNYNNKKEFINEYIRLFLNDKMNYSNKINEKKKINPKDNKLELKRIINNCAKNINKANVSTINDKSKANNNFEDNHNLNINSDNNNQDKYEKSNMDDNKNYVENINISDNLNSINNENTSDNDKLIVNNNLRDYYNINYNSNLKNNQNNDTVQESKDKHQTTNNKDSSQNLKNINTMDIVNQTNNNIISKNENLEIRHTEEKNFIEEQKESTENTDKTLNNELKNNLKTVKDYLTEEYNKYNKYKFKTICLEKIIVNNTGFINKDISYVYKMKRKFDPTNKLNDRILSELLEKLKLNCPVPDVNKYGYFCFLNNKNLKSEGLYSVIDPEILYDDITKLINLKDNFYKEDEEIKNLYLASRAKSFEYFINKTVFEKKYGTKQLPRIIYPLQNMCKIINEYIYIQNYYESELEIDGCFFVEKNFKLDENEFPFESQFYKTNFKNVDRGWNDSKSAFEFLEGDVCLLEIKTSMPKYEAKKENEKNFEKTITEFLDKMVTFEQLFKSIGIDYKRIRLILFYDVVKKCNYENLLSQILSKFKEDEKNINYIDKIYFQVIYMDSSYFANSLKKFEDEIDILKYNINDVNQKYEKAHEKYEETKEKYEETKVKYEETKVKYEETKEKYEETKEKLEDITQKFDGVNENLRKLEEILGLLYENMDEKTKKLYMEIKNKK